MGGCTSKDKTVTENEGCVVFYFLSHNHNDGCADKLKSLIAAAALSF